MDEGSPDFALVASILSRSQRSDIRWKLDSLFAVKRSVSSLGGVGHRTTLLSESKMACDVRCGNVSGAKNICGKVWGVWRSFSFQKQYLFDSKHVIG